MGDVEQRLTDHVAALAGAPVQPVRYVYRRTVTPAGTDFIVVDLWSDGIRDERFMGERERAAYHRTGGHHDA